MQRIMHIFGGILIILSRQKLRLAMILMYGKFVGSCFIVECLIKSFNKFLNI